MSFVRFVSCLCLLFSTAVSAQPFPDANPAPDCERSCLIEFVDQYLAGLVSHDPADIPWADDVKFTENNVPFAIGDGIRGTITGLVDYKLYVADERQGEAGFFGVVQEPSFASLMTMRLKVDDWKISEVE